MTELKGATSKGSISNHIKSFDGMRGLCCLLVLLVHYRFTYFNLPLSIVYIGLHFFFIMSAFLITRNLIRDKHNFFNLKQFLKMFFLKRCARIFPVYYLYLFITVALVIVLKITGGSTFGTLEELKNYGALLLTYTYNFKMWFVLSNGDTNYLSNIVFPHLWSLSLEEQFYFVIVFLAWFFNKKQFKFLCLLFILIIPIIRVYGFHWLGTQTEDQHLKTLIMWRMPFFQFDAFFWGITLAVFDYKKSKIYLYLFYALLLFIFLFGIYNAYESSVKENISFFTTYRDDKYFYNNFGIYFMDSLVNIFCVLWFLSVIYFPEKFKFLANKFLVRIGELSYGLYVFQFLFLPMGLGLAYLLNTKLHVPHILADGMGVSLYIFLNYFLSNFIYKKLELPIIYWKDKVLKKVYAKNKMLLDEKQN